MQKEISILLDKMGIDYTNSSFFDSLKLESRGMPAGFAGRGI